MVKKQIGRNTGRSGRINVSGAELDSLDLAVGAEFGEADAKEVARALTDNKYTEQFLILSPA